MTIAELIEKTNWKLDTPELDTSMDIESAYCGDLLSWVMGKGQPGQAWITVQVHSNVIAVALLRDFACVIVAENANVTPEFINKFIEEEVILIESGLPEYETAKTIASLGI